MFFPGGATRMEGVNFMGTWLTVFPSKCSDTFFKINLIVMDLPSDTQSFIFELVHFSVGKCVR